MGTFFSVGGVYTPPKKNLAFGEQKRSTIFPKKFLLRGKNCHTPPNQFWPKVWRSLGEYILPYTPPHAHVCANATTRWQWRTREDSLSDRIQAAPCVASGSGVPNQFSKSSKQTGS